jgi:hypothetical protein
LLQCFCCIRTIFPLASRILDGDKYYPFFEDCFEALNPIHAPSPEQA